jgi:hypothetical protein
MAAPLPIYSLLAPQYHGAGIVSRRMNTYEQILSLGTGNPPRKPGQFCSCGAPVWDCPFWKQVKEMVDTEPHDRPEGAAPPLQERLETLLPQKPDITSLPRLNDFFVMLISYMASEFSQKSWRMVYEQAEEYYKLYERYYTALRDLASYKIYLDGECSNLKFMTLASMGFPVRGGVHMVRDPRAYAAILKQQYPEAPIEKHALEWVAAHMRIKKLRSLLSRLSFTVVKFEDVFQNPNDVDSKLLGFFGFDSDDYPAIDHFKNHVVGLAPEDQEGFLPPEETWPQILNGDEQARVIKAAGALFTEFGYKA